jgi:hypothetical protein
MKQWKAIIRKIPIIRKIHKLGSWNLQMGIRIMESKKKTWVTL